MTTEAEEFTIAMHRFLPFGHVDRAISQMGELGEEMTGHITGAHVIVESPADGHRYELEGVRWEPTCEHPEGRLILVLSACTHWSEDCDREVMTANGR